MVTCWSSTIPIKRASGDSDMTLSDSGSWARRSDVVAMPPTLPPAHFCSDPGRGQTLAMHIPAKVDYGIRALLALAAAGTPQTAEFAGGRAGAAAPLLGCHPGRPPPGRGGGQPARRRGRLPPGPRSQRHHHCRRHPRAGWPSRRGARLPPRGHQLRRGRGEPPAGLGRRAGQPALGARGRSLSPT